MGLDATVYCNCYKTGQVKNQPPYQELVEIDVSGAVYIVTDNNDKYFEFEDWKRSACIHEKMVFLHHRLGNIGAIGHVATHVEEVSAQKNYKFPILLTKVIYSGSHAGDQLDLPDITLLAIELNMLKSEIQDDILTRNVVNDLLDLCEKAFIMQNPIVF